MESIRAKLTKKKQLNELEYRLWLEAPDIVAAAVPGQFIMMRLHDEAYPFLRRAISIRDIDQNQLVLDISVVGIGTERLCYAEVGAEFDILGPLGKGFDLTATKNSALLVGGGIGRAPLYWLAKSLLNKGKQVTVAVGGRSAEQVKGFEDLLASGLVIRYATEDGSLGEKGLVTALIDDAPSFDCLYTCGPLPMLRAIQDLALEQEIPTQISVETKMACGVGVCLGCTVENTAADGAYLKACVDGPVFWQKEIRL